MQNVARCLRFWLRAAADEAAVTRCCAFCADGSLPVRKQDEVRVLKGHFKGREGKVLACYRSKYIIHIELRSGKGHRTAVQVGIQPSKVELTKLKLDKDRTALLDRRKRKARRTRSPPPPPPPPPPLLLPPPPPPRRSPPPPRRPLRPTRLRMRAPAPRSQRGAMRGARRALRRRRVRSGTSLLWWRWMATTATATSRWRSERILGPRPLA
ncbi:hypothetical protein JKP88DRAFT_208786 [Tribonema minus]|uniref:KOW domain-containing protein n=1 Tax=Tribonema minus TaxID=303371 RepID=A0A835YRU4_9STRA|nr:hypothetical protein JKP88DRAFT_208786 [Tribonema minus]